MTDEINSIFVLVAISIFVVFAAKIWVFIAAAIYSRQSTKAKIIAQDIVCAILDASHIDDVFITVCKGSLTDCYNPGKKTIFLSEKVYDNTSVLAIAVAAHEAGHAMQSADGQNNFFISNAVQPLTSIGVFWRGNIDVHKFIFSFNKFTYGSACFGNIIYCNKSNAASD